MNFTSQDRGRGSSFANVRCPVYDDRYCASEVLGLNNARWRRRSIKYCVARCGDCGIGITLPQNLAIEDLYKDRTSQDYQPRTGRISAWIKRMAFRRDAARMIAGLGATPVCVVDYGCGSGLFTGALADVLPPNTRVIGADMHDEPPPALIDKEYRQYREMADLYGTADLLLAMHVLEHDERPVAFLKKVGRFVRPGGHIILEVPCIDCVWNDIFGQYWDAWYLPYHRLHFSRLALRQVVVKSGMSIVRVAPVSVPTMGRTLANLLNVPNNLPMILLAAALQPIQFALERMTDRPSAVRLLLQKT